MKRRCSFLQIFSMGVALMLGLALFMGAGPAAAKDNAFRYGLGTDIRTMDPPDCTDNTSELINLHMYEGLVEFDENMKIVPSLSESWKYKDPTHLVFKLRKGVKFHDGTPFNAQAVKFHFADRLLGAKPLRRARLYSPYIQSVEAVDDYTVLFTLKMPFGAFLHHLAHVAGKIVSPAAVKKYGKDIGAHPVGTGPFKFVERVPGERIVMEAFGGYWGKNPPIKKLNFQIIPEDATRLMMLEAGDLDLALRIPPDDIKRLKAKKDVQVISKPSVLNMYVGINTQKAPLNDVKVRQALNYAVDKKLISEVVLANVSTPADSPLSPVTWGYYSTGLYPFDQKKAKKLLAEAGWKPNAKGIMEKNGKPFQVTFWTPIGRYVKDTRVGEVVTGQLREIGLDVKLQTFEWGAFLSHVGKPLKDAKQELFIMAWGPSTADADWVLRPLFRSNMFKPKGSNRFFLVDKKLDELIDKQTDTVDPKERYEVCKQAQIRIMQDAPMIPIAALYQVIGIRSNVKGVIVLGTDHVLVTKAYIKK